MYPITELSLSEALDVLQRVCSNELSRRALVKIRNSLMEKTRRINELKTINTFLEEYVSGTIPN